MVSEVCAQRAGLLALVLVSLLITAEGKSFLGPGPGQGGRPAGFQMDPAPGQGGPPDYEKGLLEVGDTIEEEGQSGSSVEAAILNYLNTKKMLQRMRERIEPATASLQLQRKRNNGNYWKQCAFNAVSCFG